MLRKLLTLTLGCSALLLAGCQNSGYQQNGQFVSGIGAGMIASGAAYSLGGELDRASRVLGSGPTPVLTSTVGGYSSPPSIGSLVSAKEDVFIRTGPGKKYEGCKFIPKGQTATLLGCQGNWCQVNYQGQDGWSHKRYLTELAHYETLPTQVVYSQPVVMQQAPVQMMQMQAVPMQMQPVQMQPVQMQAVPVQTMPVQSVPLQSVPAQIPTMQTGSYGYVMQSPSVVAQPVYGSNRSLYGNRRLGYTQAQPVLQPVSEPMIWGPTK